MYIAGYIAETTRDFEVTLRIASIAALRTDDRHWYRCGLDGVGATPSRDRVFTGPDGKGLFFAGTRGPVVQLLDGEHFEIHRRLSRSDALQRIVAALLALGWGPEAEDDHSISNNPIVAAKGLHEFRDAADPGWPGSGDSSRLPTKSGDGLLAGSVRQAPRVGCPRASVAIDRRRRA